MPIVRTLVLSFNVSKCVCLCDSLDDVVEPHPLIRLSVSKARKVLPTCRNTHLSMDALKSAGRAIIKSPGVPRHTWGTSKHESKWIPSHCDSDAGIV